MAAFTASSGTWALPAVSTKAWAKVRPSSTLMKVKEVLMLAWNLPSLPAST